MSIEIITRLPDEHIIGIAILPPTENPKDGIALAEEVIKFKREVGGHIYRILDFTKLPMSFTELMMGMSADMNPEGGINDPNISTIFIGSGEWVEFGVKAFKEQVQYGQTNVKHLCTSLDEALAFARADREKKE